MPWWTETNGVWAQAFGLVATVLLQLALIWLTLREQRGAREERRVAERMRQRSETTCAGVTNIVRDKSETELCNILWAGNFRHAGFAFEKELYMQLPEYLLRKCEPFMEQINAQHSLQQLHIGRFLLVFRFPYPAFDAVLDDIDRLNFGNGILVWDEGGKPIKIRRD